MVIELQSASSVAKIETIGAELISFQDGFGMEYMWQRDPKFWGKCSPVLFPIVGNLREDKTIIEGKEYTMAKHGFCRSAEFKVMYKSETKLILSYSYNEETLKMYPYKFTLSLAYTLNDNKLEIDYTVLNLDDKPIDFCLGAHPGFNVPLEKGGSFEEYCIEFNKNESGGCPVFDFEKNQIDVDNRVNYLDNEKKLMLKYSYFDHDAMMFDKPVSDTVKLYNIKSGRGVEVKYDGFDFIAFWTPIKMEAPFLCIEPWCGIAACSDEDNEFKNKRGVKHLDIDQQYNCKLTIIPM